MSKSPVVGIDLYDENEVPQASLWTSGPSATSSGKGRLRAYVPPDERKYKDTWWKKANHWVKRHPCITASVATALAVLILVVAPVCGTGHCGGKSSGGQGSDVPTATVAWVLGVGGRASGFECSRLSGQNFETYRDILIRGYGTVSGYSTILGINPGQIAIPYLECDGSRYNETAAFSLRRRGLLQTTDMSFRVVLLLKAFADHPPLPNEADTRQGLERPVLHQMAVGQALGLRQDVSITTLLASRLADPPPPPPSSPSAPLTQQGQPGQQQAPQQAEPQLDQRQESDKEAPDLPAAPQEPSQPARPPGPPDSPEPPEAPPEPLAPQ